jgi:hypothetical protein
VIGQVVHFVFLLHAGELHGLFVERGVDEAVDFSAEDGFGGEPQVCQGPGPGYAADLAERDVGHGAFADRDDFGLLASLRHGEEFNCDFRTDAGGVSGEQTDAGS